MQAAVQKWIDSSVSKTITIPTNCPYEEFKHVYEKAYDLGLKGTTVFRPNPNFAGILSKGDEKKDCTSGKIKDACCPKRPEILPCDIHYSKVDGCDWVFFVGLDDSGRPYEIIGGKKTDLIIPKKYKTGWVRQNRKNKDHGRTYDLILDTLDENDDNHMSVFDIGRRFQIDNVVNTLKISLMLRCGIQIKEITETLDKDEGTFHSFDRSIMRILKKYIKDGAVSTDACSQCGGELRYQSGCPVCSECGHSKCS